MDVSEPETPMPWWKKIGFWICGIEKQDKAPQMTDVSRTCPVVIGHEVMILQSPTKVYSYFWGMKVAETHRNVHSQENEQNGSQNNTLNT